MLWQTHPAAAPRVSLAHPGRYNRAAMAKQNEHGRLIAAAAKAALAPLGCNRKGQSRLWISDERYWLITVEFQPSAWSRGSYLNVRPQWLWLRLGANDNFPRPADYIEFKNAEQFKPLIENMASVAAQTVLALRARFPTVADVNRHFAERITGDGWPVYRAAVTAGLAGDAKMARHLFRRIQMWDTKNWEPWIELKSESATLAALLDDPKQFRSALLATVTRMRKALHLPPDPQCLESMDSTAAR
jgi:hypothetical protein